MAARRFFDDSTNLARQPYATPRPIVGSVERLNLSKGSERVEKRAVSAWQTSAWQMFDAIGEVHFAFSLIAQILSRVRIFAAIVQHQDEAPVDVNDFVKSLQGDAEVDAPNTREACEEATKILNQLVLNAHGGISTLLRLMGLNLCVPGEMYLLYFKDEWHIASVDELTQSGQTLYYRTMRTSPNTGTKATAGRGEPLPKDAFVARIWRPHPRYSGEPDSSMLGVLDDCELLVLLEQSMRTITRSRMNAGVMFIPEGLASFVAGDEAMSVEDAISRASIESVENETAQATVVPQILKGPPELGDKIKWIPYGRQIDQQFVELVDRTLQRVLQGIDIPKEVVSGLADAKFANAIVITDELFKAHVEPLVLLCVDALTQVYLRPLLKRALGIAPGSDADSDGSNIANRIIIWADTAGIATRPDKSQAANDGFDRKVLSAKAWRDTRGFTDSDAPEEEELLFRVALQSAVIPPEIVEAVLKRIDPAFFAAARAANSEIPPEIEQLLEPVLGPPPGEAPSAAGGAGTRPSSGTTAPPVNPAPPGAAPPSALTTQLNGADINTNGSKPPRAGEAALR